jgi:hypothetical protein
MKQESTILEFPKHKIVREHVPEAQEILRVKEKNKKKFADVLVEDLTQEILYMLSDVGIDTERDDFTKDFHFFVGTLYSLVYRSLDMEHDLHKFIDEHVKLIPIKNDKENLIEIVAEDTNQEE